MPVSKSYFQFAQVPQRFTLFRHYIVCTILTTRTVLEEGSRERNGDRRFEVQQEKDGCGSHKTKLDIDK